MRVDVDKSNLVHTKTSISLFILVVGSFLFDKFTSAITILRKGGSIIN